MGAENLAGVVEGVDVQDILDLGLDKKTTDKYIAIRLGARNMVSEALKSEEGMEAFGRVMAFLNDDIFYNK